MKTILAAACVLACLAACEARSQPGSFVPADRSDAEVRAAEAIAVAAIYEAYPTRSHVEEVEAEIQVVAGLNYRFRIVMSGARRVRHTFEVVVYEDLQGEMSVTRLERTDAPGE